MNGTIKWFDPTKGYGFIAPSDGSPDVFCHASVVKKADLAVTSILPGLPVMFDLVTKNRRAISIRLIHDGRFWTHDVKREPIYKHWHSVFRQKVLNAGSYQQFEKEAILATLEAIVRTARKQGYTIKHTSDFKHRVSSRYIVVPNVGICRVSDHSLGPQHRKYWNGEIIIKKSEWQQVTLANWMKQVRQRAAVRAIV